MNGILAANFLGSAPTVFRVCSVGENVLFRAYTLSLEKSKLKASARE